MNIRRNERRIKMQGKKQRRQLHSKKEKYSHVAGSKKKSIEKSESVQSIGIEPDPSVILLDIRSSDNVDVSDESILDEHEGNELFNSIFSGRLVPVLPNRSWAIHFVEEPERCIVISEMKIRFETEAGLTPVHTRQIVFDENMNYEMFFLNAKASMIDNSFKIETLTDLANVTMFANNIKLCSGGPATFLYANVNPECAYRDQYGRWRHNLCTLEVTDNVDTCEPCLSLIKMLFTKHTRKVS